MLQAPAFLFPSYTIFIDDDLLYPQLITSDIANCPPIASMSDVDTVLNQKERDFIFLDAETNRSSEEIFTRLKNDLHRKTSSLPHLVSVLIVDLNMDTMSGIELLRQIKSPFVYKVLISNYISVKDDELVKSAQNIGVIDEVIEKGKHLVHSLPKIIYRGQTKFFTRLSAHLFAGIETHHYLADTNVADKFLEMTKRLEPHTIWPDETLASFTLMKKHEPASTIFFTTQHEIDALLACYDIDQIPQHTLRRLRQEDYIVCHKNPHTLDVEEWPYYLRPAQKLEGTNGPVLFHVMNEKDIARM